jgi:hypothetical protein
LCVELACAGSLQKKTKRTSLNAPVDVRAGMAAKGREETFWLEAVPQSEPGQGENMDNIIIVSISINKSNDRNKDFETLDCCF